MTDVKVINGVASSSSSEGDDQTADSMYDVDKNETVLSGKIEALEKEKEGLIMEKEEMKERMKKLRVEMEEVKGSEEEMKERLGDMEKEFEQWEEDKKVLESIAARALELETEVSRLQHDLISSMSEGEEANVEIRELKRVLGENGGRIEGLEREKVESEKKVRELERKIGVLEVRESEERSKRVRVEEDMRERVDEKEREINGFKRKVEDLELEKKGVEEALRESEEKARAMEEAHRVKERSVEAINGTLPEVVMRSVDDGEEGGLKLQWPVLAAAGIIAVAAAVVYLRRR